MTSWTDKHHPPPWRASPPSETQAGEQASNVSSVVAIIRIAGLIGLRRRPL
jgi:hypothetical protein